MSRLIISVKRLNPRRLTENKEFGELPRMLMPRGGRGINCDAESVEKLHKLTQSHGRITMKNNDVNRKLALLSDINVAMTTIKSILDEYVPTTPTSKHKGNFKHLIVVLPDGSRIENNVECDTYIEAIRFLDIENVARISDKVITIRPPITEVEHYEPIGRYYVRKHIAVNEMYRNLKSFSEKLNVNLDLTVLPKKKVRNELTPNF